MEQIAEWIPTIITGLFLYYWQRAQKARDDKKEKEIAEKENLRQKGAVVNSEMVEAAMELSYATAMAWKNGKPNGEVDASLKFYNKAKKDKDQYEREVKSTLLH